MLVIFIIGPSGSGKTYVANKLRHIIPCYSHDDSSIEDWIYDDRQIVLFESPVMWSTYIKLIKEKTGKDPIVIGLGADFIQTKSNILKRNGKITPTLYRRHKRAKTLTELTTTYDAIHLIKKICKQADKKHIIYKATSPSGKIYIGKTVGDIKKRIREHNWYATNRHKEWAFSRAIRKYGIENIKFEVEAVVFGAEAASIKEAQTIQQYKSNDSNLGYNETGGREGRTWLIEEKEQSRRKNISNSLKKQSTRDKLSNNTQKMWKNEELRDQISKNIKKTRSSSESRKRTSDINKKRYEDPVQRLKLSESVKKKYSEKGFIEQFSKNSLKRQEKLFECRLLDGTLIGYFKNQAEASKKLNIPQCGISSTLNGRLTQSRGYVFSYVSDDNQIKMGENNETNNSEDRS